MKLWPSDIRNYLEINCTPGPVSHARYMIAYVLCDVLEDLFLHSRMLQHQ